MKPERLEDVLRVCDRMLDLDGPAGPDTPLLQAGIDSIEVVNLIAALEDEFGVDIPLELLSLQSLTSPTTIWQVLLRADPR